ncbi:MAG: hypothetical protein HIU91_13475 [Acidobacteria bacterium]|nr:hypothetical protein [Acidobacteriota bacterium]
MQKRILIVTHDEVLRATRSTLLSNAGYQITAVATADEAVQLIDNERFDLVVIGRTSRLPPMPLDQRLRELYPHLLMLKIAQPSEVDEPFPSRTTKSDPVSVLQAIRGMLGLGEGAVIISTPSLLLHN